MTAAENSYATDAVAVALDAALLSFADGMVHLQEAIRARIAVLGPCVPASPPPAAGVLPQSAPAASGPRA